MLRFRHKTLTLYVSLSGASVMTDGPEGGRPQQTRVVDADPRHFPAAAFAALRDVLEGTAAHSVRVVVSDRLVRYLVVAEVPGLRSVAELHDLIAARHHQVFGSDGAGWHIVSDLVPFASRYLSCAVECGLLEGLHRSIVTAGKRLDSVQPAFIAAQRQWHARLRPLPGWFALADRDAVTIGYCTLEGWAGVRVHSGSVRSVAGIATLLRRDRLHFGASADEAVQRLWLCGLGGANGTKDDAAGLDIEYLPDAHFADHAPLSRREPVCPSA